MLEESISAQFPAPALELPPFLEIRIVGDATPVSNVTQSVASTNFTNILLLVAVDSSF